MGSTRRIALAGAHVASGAAATLAVACDPSGLPPASDNGPPFLIVGTSAWADAAADAGQSLYVQSRGGNYVGIVTHGCTHALGPYADTTESCGLTSYVSTTPLYFTADPEGVPCNVEVRLYSICDCLDGGEGGVVPYDYLSGSSVFQWCDSNGTPVASQVVFLGPPGTDASDVPEAGDAEAGVDGGAVLPIDASRE
jgi:hypothetical protein